MARIDKLNKNSPKKTKIKPENTRLNQISKQPSQGQRQKRPTSIEQFKQQGKTMRELVAEKMKLLQRKSSTSVQKGTRKVGRGSNKGQNRSK
jgi:hypothetical protein